MSEQEKIIKKEFKTELSNHFYIAIIATLIFMI